MQLTSTEVVDAPLEQVYTLVRDDMAALVPFLPNIRAIEVIERSQDAQGQAKRINHWFAEAEIPALAQKFIKPEVLSWKDTAHWDDAEHRVCYALESFLANDLFDAQGTNTFRARGAQECELHVLCDVTIHADKIPGIPRLLSKRMLPLIEGMLDRMLRPNLTQLAAGLNAYFAQR